MPSAGSATLDAAGQDLYKDSDGCTEFLVKCLAASANRVLVNVPGLHIAAEFFILEKGAEVTFRLNDLGIRQVFAKGEGGAASVTYGIVSKTNPRSW